MRIEELILRLIAIQEKEGNLSVSIERHTGIFSKVNRLETAFILDNITKPLSDAGVELSGHNYVVIKPEIY